MRWFLCLATLVVIPFASAAIDDESTVNLAADETWTFSFEIEEKGGGTDEPVPMTVTTTVQAGPAVNMFLLDSTNYALFEDGEGFSVLHEQRIHGITDTHTAKLELDDAGLYNIVWNNYDYDNDQMADGESTFHIQVSSEDVEESPGPALILVAAGLLALAAIVRRRP